MMPQVSDFEALCEGGFGTSAKAYQSDVRGMSDEELDALSSELESAYCTDGYDDFPCWSDEEAESRYSEMCAEMHRRKPVSPNVGILSLFRMSLSSTSLCFDDAEGKTGEPITIRRPVQLLSEIKPTLKYHCATLEPAWSPIPITGNDPQD